MLLTDILVRVKPLQVVGTTEKEIHALQFDSRKIQAGDVFIATTGTAADGHAYIDKAIEQGAVAIVCERMPEVLQENITYIHVEKSQYALGLMACTWYGEPSQHLTLVGVTGTNGKTTIATLLYKMARGLGYKAGLLSTVVNYVDETPVESTHTTPDALELNGLLRQMVDAGCSYAFMEVSSHASDQDRIAGLDFDGGLFTNLTRDHIDYHKTFENYRNAKKKFFDNLKSSAFAVTNKDDKNGLVMLQNTAAKKYTYSVQQMADFRAQILEEGFDGMLLKLNEKEIFVQLVGRFNASNTLAIYGAAICLGWREEEVLRVLSTESPVNGRFEAIRSPKGWTAIVDYAHTPDAVTNVINTINDIRKPGSRLVTVCGCGGNRDKGKRPIMAQEAVKGSTQVILTSDNPRKEDPMDILNDMLAGLTEDQKLQTLVIADRREAIKTACMLAGQNDVILVAGKGHEDYQIIGETKHHFDDHEEVRKYI